MDGADLAAHQMGRVISDDLWGALCVFAEARGEPYEGQVAVGNVVRQRTKLRFFSSGSVVSTVCNPYQFSWMNTGDAQRTRVLSADWSDPAWKTAVRAWFESEMRDEVPGALWYHADYVTPAWSKAQGITLVKRIGRHLFYARVIP